MMGWIIMVLIAAAVAAYVLLRSAFPRQNWQILAAFLMLGFAGYAWQGHPDVPGQPVVSQKQAAAGDGNVRRFLTTGFGPAGETLGYSEAWLKVGRPDLAVRIIKLGLQKQPSNPDLWVALGGALTAASDGMVTPAAQFAFGKAAGLAPQHPAPAFFEGLAAAQNDKVEDAARIWFALYERTPPNALWRPDLEMRLSAIAQTLVNAPNSANSLE